MRGSTAPVKCAGYRAGGRAQVAMDDRNRDRDRGQGEFLEKLVKLNRVAKVVKGGRRFSFSALTVVGDRAGRVGYGFGKANDVSDAIRKSIEKAKRSMVRVPIKKATLPHQVIGKFKSAQVLLKPAAPGPASSPAGPSARSWRRRESATSCPSRSARRTPSTR